MSALVEVMDTPSEDISFLSERSTDTDAPACASQYATPVKTRTIVRGYKFLVALACQSQRSRRRASPASRAKGPRLLKCLPGNRHQSTRLLGLYQQSRHAPDNFTQHGPPQMQQLFDALEKLRLSTRMQFRAPLKACRNQSFVVCHSYASDESPSESAQSGDSVSSLSSPCRSYISEGLDVVESKFAVTSDAIQDVSSASDPGHCESVPSNDSVSSLSSHARSFIFESRDASEPKLAAVSEAIEDTSQSPLELPEMVQDKEQPAAGVVVPEQASKERELHPSLPETGKQLPLVASTLQTSELIASDPSLAEVGLAEEASDEELPEVSVETDTSALQLAGVEPRLGESHCLGNGTRDAQFGHASHAVAALLPPALRSLKRVASFAEKAKERVKEASRDMVDVDLAYVAV